ncbi:hypothetical protein LZ017_12135 [Pelomonas sp. CA6]|uniref:hypothetical protein n=1 Tax=Pelomonas sp. CA6 TaxID=2907999 RepID=UPI001F4C09E9|nr:hypothetical protein [Pelomonas sp. CA6]MCH7344125.1 hypothetical protein [Pelomonas sp. CA6]
MAPRAAGPAPEDTAPPRELRVSIRPHQLAFWAYQGSQAQLEAEGVIPPGLVWPAPRKDCSWSAGRFVYQLRRCRPQGLKGPLSAWSQGDWWELRCRLAGGAIDDSRAARASTGRASVEAPFPDAPTLRRHRAARQDAGFQAFLNELLPACKKRGRKPKAAGPTAARRLPR